MTNDLSLVPLKDLVDEIARRHEATVVGCYRDSDDSTMETYLNSTGSYMIGLGLCARLMFRIEEGLKNVEQDNLEA